MIFAWEVFFSSDFAKFPCEKEIAWKSCELLFLVIYMYYKVNTDVEKVPYILITMCEIDEGAFNEKKHKYLYIGMSRFMVRRCFLFIPSMFRQWTKFLRTLPFQAPHFSSSMSPIFRTLGNPVSSWVLTLTTPFYS